MKFSIFCFFVCVGLVARIEAQPTWDFLKEHLMLSYSSYCHENAGLANWTCYWCVKGPSNVVVSKIIYQESSDTYGWIGYQGKQNQPERIIVSFRGTVLTSIQNWITDLTFAKLSPYPNLPNVQVHKGFYDAYINISDQVRSELQNLRKLNASAPIILTGHSLGAALSAIGGVDLTLNNFKNLYSYTFGLPRVGDQNFADFFAANVGGRYRAVNQLDPVPHLPPRIFNFRHPAYEVWFQNDDINFKVCDSSGEDLTCSDSVFNIDVFDHFTYLGFDERDGHPYGCGHSSLDQKSKK
jgi:hypothetical protein